MASVKPTIIQSMAVTREGGYFQRVGELIREMVRDVYGRRRLIPLAVLAALALIAGLVVGGLKDSEVESAARDFGEAWEERDYSGMWRMLTPSAQSETSPEELTGAYEEAMGTATGTRVVAGDVREEDGGATLDVEVETRIFGTVEGRVELPVT